MGTGEERYTTRGANNAPVGRHVRERSDKLAGRLREKADACPDWASLRFGFRMRAYKTRHAPIIRGTWLQAHYPCAANAPFAQPLNKDLRKLTRVHSAKKRGVRHKARHVRRIAPVRIRKMRRGFCGNAPRQTYFFWSLKPAPPFTPTTYTPAGCEERFITAFPSALATPATTALPSEV